jgi:hypothetical protein
VHFARDMLAAVGRLFTLWYRFRGEAGTGELLLSRDEVEPANNFSERVLRLFVLIRKIMWYRHANFSSGRFSATY